MRTYFIKTYGCQMNKHDTERIAGLLEASRFKVADDIISADVVVYYTCCVRESASNRFFGQISSVNYKKGAIIAVGGCLAQSEGKDLLKRFKKIDIIFGTKNLSDLNMLINKVNSAPLVDIGMKEGFSADLPSKRKSKEKAWVTINQGCNNHCSYCIVPDVRGSEESRKENDILAEVKRLKNDGVLEITLLGQNVNSYGNDLGTEYSFAQLLAKISEIGLKRIRFTTSHPKDLTEDIVKIISKRENICNHIHLPVQAGSTSVLRAMNRGYTKEQYIELAGMIRDIIPKCSLTTDIIVGFPSETDEDFNETLDLAEKVQFDQAFTFIYNKRQGTKAAQMKDEVSYEQKLKRFNKLIKLQEEINLARNALLTGTVQEILVEGKAKKMDGFLSGRTKCNKLVHFKGINKKAGQFLDVKILDAKPYFLVGELNE